MVELTEISEDNFYEVINLKVSDEEAQAKFVASNVRSIAECWLYRENDDVFPYAVYDKDEVVGFLLLDLDEENNEVLMTLDI